MASKHSRIDFVHAMGNVGRQKAGKGSLSATGRRDAVRSAPYPKKPRVDVRYEGAPPNQANPKSGPPKTADPGHSVKVKGKGKARAVESPLNASGSPIILSDSPIRPGVSTCVIIAGSYEKLLYGLQVSYESGSTKPTLKPIFIFPAHLACVKAVAASPGGKWLATGSEDEFIKVWDLRRRKEVGSLSQHEGKETLNA